jgi:3-hydroxyisobutyrate dehydrogenase-like beta-hydroxyacid dehydrogenase
VSRSASKRSVDSIRGVHKKHGSFYVATAVSGRPEAAGQLISYLAGAPAAIEEVRPVCTAYSKQIIVLSDRPRVANVMKLAINYNVISAIEVISETYLDCLWSIYAICIGLRTLQRNCTRRR